MTSKDQLRKQLAVSHKRPTAALLSIFGLSHIL